jgi:hypothetical protein
MKLGLGTRVSVEYRLLVMAMAGILCLGFWLVSLVPPPALPLPECVFHALTGHSCLTCGMTRSLHAIAHGDWRASIHYHMFGPVLFVGIILGFLGFGAEAICGKKIIPQIRRRPWQKVLLLMAAAWVLYWLARLVTE